MKVKLLFLLGLFLVSGFAVFSPVPKAEAVSQPLSISTTSLYSHLTIPHVEQPSSWVRFTPSGQVFVSGADKGQATSANENASIDFQSGFPNFVSFQHNSTYWQYSGTVGQCVLTISYRQVGSNLKQTIAGSNCASRSFLLAVTPHNGHSVSALNSTGGDATKAHGGNACSLRTGGFTYSWCGDKITGATISYNGAAVLLQASASSFSVDPSVVQKVGYTTFSTNTCTMAFSSNVQSGNLLVALFHTYSNPTLTVSSVTDSRSTSYSQSVYNLANTFEQAWEYYGAAGSAGADTITVSLSGTPSSSGNCMALELSNVSVLGATATGSGTGTSLSVSSFAFSGSYMVVAFAGTASVSETWTAGSSYTIIDTTTGLFVDGETSSTISSPSTAPMTISSSASWDEVVAVYTVNVTQPVTCTMNNSAPQATVTLSGGSVSPTTDLCDGVTRNLTVLSGATITATEPADGTNTRNRFSGGGTTTTVVACATGTCTNWAVTNYYQFVLNGLNSLFTASRISVGVNGSVTSNDWYDYGTKFKITGAILSPNTIVTYPSTLNMPVYVNQPCIDGSQVLTNVSTTGAGCGQSGIQGQSEAVFSAAKVKVVYFFPPGANVIAIYDNGAQLTPTITTVPQGSIYTVTGSSLWIVNYALAPKGTVGGASNSTVPQGISSSTTGFQYLTYAGVLGGGGLLGYMYYERSKRTPEDWLKTDIGGKTLGALSPETGNRRHASLSPRPESRHQRTLERSVEGSRAYRELSAALGSGALGGLATKPNKSTPLKELQG